MLTMRSQLLLGFFAIAHQIVFGGAIHYDEVQLDQNQQYLRRHAGERNLEYQHREAYQKGRSPPDRYDDDDYYYSSKSGKHEKSSKKHHSKSSKHSKKSKSKKSGKSSKGGRHPQEPGDGNRGTIRITTETVSPPANEVIGPNGIGVDPLSPGSVYVFSNRTRHLQNLNKFEFPAFANGEEATVLGMLDGYCTRTGASTNTVGYCHFTYSLFDAEDDMALLGTIVAQGAMPPAPSAAVFAVTGGTGFFVGATGLVEVVGCILDEMFDPPMLVSTTEDTDILQDVDAYVHYIEIEVDEFFFSGDGAPENLPERV